MIDVKPWWMSKAMWGGIVAAAAGIAGVAGLSLDATDQAQIVDWIVSGATIAGGIMAMIGRLMAKSELSGK